MEPLAARLRPQHLDEFMGQTHLLAPGKPLWQAIQNGKPHSMILWGPPGTGKTTLAKLLANNSNVEFISISAVMSGVREVRQAIEDAQKREEETHRKTILFVDEVHRFNKSQQDVFLPFVENGTIIFIGATTENPSFEINNALLSRCRVYILESLKEIDMLNLIESALKNPKSGFQSFNITFPPTLQQLLAKAADGDARQCLNLLEVAISHAGLTDGNIIIDEPILQEVMSGTLNRFDKGGDIFYDQISALHKSVRGSSPDAALYWFARMVSSGCDLLYIARRVVRMASEDIGNADPKALEIALNAWQVQERLGSPEGELAIAQAIIYMAIAAKSNASYVAFNAAMHDAKAMGSLSVPIHIRNAPTTLLKSMGHGKQYRYDHDEINAFAAGQTYFPDSMGEKIYYHPVERGLEIKIKEKLETLRLLSRKKINPVKEET